MRSLLSVIPFVFLTMFCWGNYGPLMRTGESSMGDGLRSFICVGLAYFLIAVIVPIGWLVTRGEKGNWTRGGAIWSFVAGCLGAFGALGVLLALRNQGSPVYVMPLVFGCAPVVNTITTMWLAKSFREAGTLFLLGLVVVASGAVGVLIFKPAKPKPAENITVKESTDEITVQRKSDKDATKSEIWTAKSAEELETESPEGFALYKTWKDKQKHGKSVGNPVWILPSIALAAFSWGAYGPLLHKGQMKMGQSRLRPLLCVGLAYFVIAVVAPAIGLGGAALTDWNLKGATFSLAAGAAGAIGALGIILAFNFGGKPIFVMPLVFGGAPVVNTITTIIADGTYSQISTLFIGSLLMVIAGAVMVLVFAPKPAHGPGPGKPPAPAGSDKPQKSA